MPINFHSTDGRNKNVAEISTIIGSKLAARPLLAYLWVAITW